MYYTQGEAEVGGLNIVPQQLIFLPLYSLMLSVSKGGLDGWDRGDEDASLSDEVCMYTKPYIQN